ncbi:hypothetical protein [Bacillus seohaeanensis]|uniref:NERD domain-containing protein n=1 Tax=Bacillus seohaeanensis TaxID=284580 RepID=A0ABW5RR79_9BACI
MRKINNSNTFVYLTYSDLFGYKDTELSLINAIKNKPLLDTLQLLSRLQYIDYMDQHTKKTFLLYLQQKGLLNERVASIVANRAIINYQCILTLWKYIFAFGDEKMLTKSSSLSETELLGHVITLCAKIGDMLYRGESTTLESELIRNIHFNNRPEVFASLGRSSYIYLDLAADRERYNKKEFIDIQTDFSERNPYTMKEYFAVITSLISRFSKGNIVTSEPVSINPERYYKDVTVKEAGIKIVNELSFTFLEAKEWAKENLKLPWNFSLFQINPLFNYDGQHFIPVCIPFLEDEVYEAFFFKVRKMYTNDKILGFLGRPFEEYTALVGRQCVKESKVPYQYIEEFSFGEKNSKKSPDVMIRLGKKLAIFEVKNRRVRAAAFLQGDELSIKKDLDRTFIEPVKQAFTSISEILTTEISDNLSGIEEVYIFSVTNNKCNNIGIYDDYVNDELQQVSSSELVKGCISLDIEEYEALCYLVSRKRPIFKIVDEF